MKLILCGILIFSWLVVRPSSAAHPLSPCPDVFNYEGEEPEYNLWYGEIWLKTVQSLVGIWLDIELDRPSDLMVSWTGEITTDDNLKYTVLNLMQRLKPGVPVLSRIMVKFNRSKGIPRVRSIRLNGRQICPKDSAAFTPKPEESAVGSQSSQNTKRPDPDFGESPDEYPISNNKPSTQSNNNSNKNPSNTQQSNNNNSNKNKNPPNKQPNTTKPPNANKPPNGGNNPPKNRPRPTMTTEEPSFSTKKTTTRKPSQSNAGRPNTVSLQAPDPNGDINSLISGYLENQQQNTSVYITTIDVDQLNLLEQENTGSSSETPRPDTSNNNNNFGQSKPSTNSRPPAVQPSWSSNNNQGTSSSSISTTNVPQLSDICGRVRMTVPLVTYGESTHRGQWPWHAALYTIEGINLNYNCGGSLISKNKVITAAHCVMERFYDEVIDSRKLVIHLGKYHQVQYSEEMGVQTKSVTRITVYPTYNTTNFLGDIAVLTLTTSVVFSPYVVPVCLWDENSVDLKDVEGKDGTVVGWGWDEKDKPSVELKMAQMPIVSRETCVSSNPKVFSLFTSEKTFCAGFRNGTSVCNGDSGGGMVLNMDSRWYLRGVVSNAVSKENQRVCDPKHYVVFTDVAKYLDFVKENL